MALLGDFHPLVAVETPGAAGITLDHAIRQSCIEFCRRSGVLRKPMLPSSLVAGSALYPIILLGEESAEAMLYATVDSRPADKITSEVLSRAPGGPAKTGTPVAVLLESASQIRVWPVPESGDAGKVVEASFLVIPTNVASSVDDVLLSEWGAAIAHGAAFRLQAMPGHRFSDAGSAAYHKREYDMEIARARMQSESQGGAALTVRFDTKF